MSPLDLRSTIVGAIVAAFLTVPASLYVGRTLDNEQDARDRPGRVSIHPISAPRAYVGRTVLVQGDVDIPADADLQLWIVVRVDVNSASTYYPQGAAIVDDEHHWRCTVNLGSRSASDDGPYAVKAELVNGATARQYNLYAKKELADDANGMEEYDPEVVVRSDMLPLQRKMSIPSEPKQYVGRCD